MTFRSLIGWQEVRPVRDHGEVIGHETFIHKRAEKLELLLSDKDQLEEALARVVDRQITFVVDSEDEVKACNDEFRQLLKKLAPISPESPPTKLDALHALYIRALPKPQTADDHLDAQKFPLEVRATRNVWVAGRQLTKGQPIRLKFEEAYHLLAIGRCTVGESASELSGIERWLLQLSRLPRQDQAAIKAVLEIVQQQLAELELHLHQPGTTGATQESAGKE
jgi:hypothetical protein